MTSNTDITLQMQNLEKRMDDLLGQQAATTAALGATQEVLMSIAEMVAAIGKMMQGEGSGIVGPDGSKPTMGENT